MTGDISNSTKHEKGAAMVSGNTQKEKMIYKRVILAFMFFTGFCSIGYEVLLERAVTILVGSSSVAMGLIISTFILGYLSSFYFGKLADRIGSKKKLVELLAVLESLICISLILVIPVTRYSLIIADYLNYLIFFRYLEFYYIVLITIGLIALVVPLLMGAEIPIAMKLMAWIDSEEGYSIHDEVGRISGKIFTFDSLGAGVGGLISALILIPGLGRTYTAFLLGLVTLGSAMMLLFVHRWYIRSGRRENESNHRTGKKGRETDKEMMKYHPFKMAVIVLVAVMIIFLNISDIEENSLDRFYGGKILFHKDSKYQEIVITEHPQEGGTLYLNGQLQISEMDDAMYHEFLIHPAMVTHPCPRRILVIGGGDGGAVEEILKHDIVEEIVFVELDPEVIKACEEYFTSINHKCFDDPRVTVKITDGRIFVRDYEGEKFDVVVGDLPDPDTEAVAMLYTAEFFNDVKNILKDDGLFVVQSASWFEYPGITMSIVKTLRSAFPKVDLYLYNVWTFGPWSYSIASEDYFPHELAGRYINETLTNRTVETDYYNQYTHQASFSLAKNPYLEKWETKARISTIDRPVLQNPWE